MPSVRRRVTATTADSMSGQRFKFIPPGGAVINLWSAGVTATDDIGLLVGQVEILPAGTDINIEVAADVLDRSRDQLLFNEFVQGGELFVPVTVTTEMQYLLALAYA